MFKILKALLKGDNEKLHEELFDSKDEFLDRMKWSKNGEDPFKEYYEHHHSKGGDARFIVYYDKNHNRISKR